jgi:hypothetical protein
MLNVYKGNASFFLGIYTYMNLGVFPHKRLGSKIIFERGKFGRLKK